MKASILIVDDEANIRMVVRATLEAEGYQITEAANGREAISAIELRSIDLVILDLNMPVMDGMATLDELRRLKGQAIPRVIVLTAFGSISTAVRATKLGAVDFLEKPITPDVLREAVMGVLAEPAPAEEVEATPTPAGYEQAIHQIRQSLRQSDLTNAESLLTDAADQHTQHGAEYFNLLGVLYESQRKWRLARKCYGKAISTNRRYEPAQTNMRRLYELTTWGSSKQPVMLGDEAGNYWTSTVAEMMS